MTWWLRFCLGLPARPEDCEEVRRSFPELFDPGFAFDERLLVPWWRSPFVRGLTVEDLRRWASAGEPLSRPAAVSPEDCPAEECPLRKGAPQARSQAHVVILRLMGVGGAHKPPRDELLDLVRRVHKHQDVREVILTDPYVYLDLSEQGQPGGYSALLDYIGALGLTRDSTFDLK